MLFQFYVDVIHPMSVKSEILLKWKFLSVASSTGLKGGAFSRLIRSKADPPFPDIQITGPLLKKLNSKWEHMPNGKTKEKNMIFRLYVCKTEKWLTRCSCSPTLALGSN